MSTAPAPGHRSPSPTSPDPSASGRVADLLLRTVGGALTLIGGYAVAALAVLLVPLRVAHLGLPGAALAELAPAVGAARLPAAVVVAVGGTLFLSWFARASTGVRWALLLPAAGWFTMVVLALRTTTEGDRLLMPDDWMAAITLFGGTTVLVVAVVLGATAPTRR